MSSLLTVDLDEEDSAYSTSYTTLTEARRSVTGEGLCKLQNPEHENKPGADRCVWAGATQTRAYREDVQTPKKCHDVI